MLTRSEAEQKINEAVFCFKKAVSPDSVTQIGARKGTLYFQLVDELEESTKALLSDRVDNKMAVGEFLNTISGMQRRATA